MPALHSQDPNPQVKDTTAWTISRIFEFLHDAASPNPIITNDLLPGIMSTLLDSLKVCAAQASRGAQLRKRGQGSSMRGSPECSGQGEVGFGDWQQVCCSEVCSHAIHFATKEVPLRSLSSAGLPCRTPHTSPTVWHVPFPS
jgi:hypothetical protein